MVINNSSPIRNIALLGTLHSPAPVTGAKTLKIEPLSVFIDIIEDIETGLASFHLFC